MMPIQRAPLPFAPAALAVAALFAAACAPDTRPAGSPPFQSELPPVPIAADPARGGNTALLPSRERELCELLARTGDFTLDPSRAAIVIRIEPTVGLRADALDAARQLARALHAPSGYAKPGDRSGCGIAEMGRETAMAEVRDPAADSAAALFELHVAAWPGRDEVLRGRARVFVGDVE